MQYAGILIFAAAVFGCCFLFDRCFTKAFRDRKEHKTGLSVRLGSRSAAFGLIMAVIGIAAIITGTANGWFFYVGGGVMILVGAVLIVQYMTFGIYYGDDTFVLSTFGKPSTTYTYRDISAQQLYNTQGSIVVELHMSDGRTVMLQSTMKNVYAFLDHAAAAWQRQNGRLAEDCPFYDPQNSHWFPGLED